MPRLNNNEADITLVKQTGTVLTVCADQTYVDGDPVFNLSVQGGTTAAGSASADVDVSSTQGTAGGTNISGVIGTKASSEPSSGYYIRMDATGSGNSQVSTAGWIGAGSMATASASATKYFPIDAGSVTQNAPTINTSTGLVTAIASTTAGYVPNEQAADSNTLQLPTQAAQTINTSNSDQSIPAGKYLTGAQTIKAVTTSGISAANIKDGVTVKVGDANDDDRIAGVTGTFTDASTVSAGQTAAGAANIMSGYSAWVDGAEVQGSLAAKTASDVTVNADTVTIPAGAYASQVTKTVASGSVTENTPTIDASTGVVTATATVVEGYVEDGTETATLNLATHPGATVTPTRSIQTVSTGSKWCTGDVSVAAIPSDYYLLGEIFPIGSFYANTTGTDPAVTLQFGTWTLVRSIPYRWMDVAINEWDSYEENDDWSFSNHVSEDVYVFQRTA